MPRSHRRRSTWLDRTLEPRNFLKQLILIAVVPFSVGYAMSASGASSTWLNSGSADGNWTTTTNWVGGIVPGDTVPITGANADPSVATFDSAVGTFGTTGSPIVIDSASENIAGITFDTAAGNYFIGTTGGSSLYLSNGGAIQLQATLAASVTETVNAPIVIQGTNGTYTFSNNNTNGLLKFGGTINLGANTLNVNGTDATTLSGIVSSATGAIVKAGAGTLILSGANTFGGGLTIKAGTVSGTTSVAAFGAGSVTLGDSATNASATLSASGNLTFANAITVASVSAGTLTITNGSSTPTFSGAVTLNNNLRLYATGTGSVKLTGVITGSKDIITDSDAGASVTLATPTSNPNWTGNLIINTGTYKSTASANALSVNNVVAVNAGANFAYGDQSYTIAGLVDGASGGGTVTAAVTGKTLTLGGAGNYAFSGAINNNVALTIALAKTGTGTQTLSGTNNYTGATTVSAGTLNLTGTGAITGSAIAVSGGATLNATALNAITGAASLALGNGNTSTGAAVLSQANNFTGGISLSNHSLNVLTLADPNAVASSSGISITAGTLNLYSNATNNFTIASLSTVGGTPTINVDDLDGTTTNRTLTITGPLTPRSNGSVTVAGGHGYKLNLNSVTLNNVAGEPSTFNPTNVSMSIGNATIVTATVANTLTLGGGTTDNAVTGVISNGTGTMSVTMSGTGVWTLSAASTYTGITTVSSGILATNSLANGGAASGIGQSTNAAANLVINGGTFQYTGPAVSTDRNFTIGNNNATLDASGTGALTISGTPGFVTTNSARTLTLTGTNANNNMLSGILGNNGTGVVSLTKRGTGTWALTAANTFTGTTTVNGGKLLLDFSTAGAPTTNIINNVANSSALSLGGGTLSVTLANSSTATTQRFASTTFAAGASALRVTQNGNSNGSSGITLGALTRSAGGTVDFTLPTTGTITTSTTTATNNINGSVAYSTVDGTTWATNAAGTLGALAAGSYQTDSFATATGNTDLTTNNAPAAFTVNTLRFSAASKTLTVNSSGPSTVTAGGILVTSAGTGSVLAAGGAGATLRPGSSGKEIIVHNYADLDVSVPLADNSAASAVTIGGNGTTTLSAANTFTGALTVGGGTLKLAAAGSVPSTNALTTAGPGIFDLNGVSRTFGLVTNSGTITNSGAAATLTMGNNSAGTNGTFSGNLSVIWNQGASSSTMTANFNNTGTITNSGTGVGSVTIAGNIGPNITAVTQNSATSNLIINSVNNLTYAGSWTINAGTLTANGGTGNSYQLGTGTIYLGATSGNAAATLDLGNNALAATLRNPLTVRAGSNGKLMLRYNSSSGNATYSGPITLANNLTIAGIASGGFTISSSISGPGNLTFDNPLNANQFIVSGLSLNNAGTMTFTGSGVVPTSVSGNIGANVTGIIQKSATSTLSLTGVNSNYAGATSIVLGTLSLGSATALGGNGSATGTGGSLTIAAGTALDAGAAVTISTVNAENWNGSFNFVGSNSLNLGTGAVTIAGPLTLTAFANTLTVGGPVSGGNGIFDITKAGPGSFVYNANTVLAANQSVTVNEGKETLGGNLSESGSRGLTLTGAGTLVLSGANTYSGTTTINGGVLQFTRPAALAGGNSANWTPNKIVVANGATLSVSAGGASEFVAADVTTLLSNLAASTATTGLLNGSAVGLDTTTANFTYNGVIANVNSGSNAIGLLKSGINTLTLSGTNTYSGPTTVTGGTLALSGATASVANSDVTVTNGSTLAFDTGTSGVATTRAKSVTLQGATLTVTGNATADSADVMTNALTIDGNNRGLGGVNYVTLTANAGKKTQLSVGSIARANHGIVSLAGSNLGNTPAAGVANLLATTAPTLVGGGGTAGSTTISILPWATNGTAGGFVTYDAATGLRLLNTSTEYKTSNVTSTWTATDNILIAASTTSTTATVSANTTVNSLFVTSSANTALIDGTGTLTVASGAVFINVSGSGTATISAPLNFGAVEGVIGYSRGKVTTISGAISGTGGLTLYQSAGQPSEGSGGTAVTLSGANTYTGDTYLFGRLDPAVASLPSGGRTGDIYDYGLLNVATMTINGLYGNGIVTKTSNGTLTFGDNNASGNFTGSINLAGSSTAVLNLIKTGTGTQSLGGFSTFTGTTTVNAGILNIQHGTALGSTLAGTTVASGATLQIQGNIAVGAEALALSGTGAAGQSGALVNVSGANEYNGPISLAANTTIAADSGTLSLTNAAGISGATFGLTLTGNGNGLITGSIATTTGTLTKSGSGTWTALAAHTYTGNTTISAGQLQVGSLSNGAATTVAANAQLSANRIIQTSLALQGSAGNTAGLTTIRASGSNPIGDNTGASTSHLGTLTIDNSGATIAAPPPVTGYAGSQRTYYAALDLKNNDLIVDNSTPGNDNDLATSQLGAITDMLRSGAASTGNLAAPDWSGKGINSSYIAAQGTFGATMALGVIRNVVDPTAAFNSTTNPARYGTTVDNAFDGLTTLAGNETLVKYTWRGDADLDGKLTSFDFALLDAGFAGASQSDGSKGWFFGDFDYNGLVDTQDYNLLSTAYLTGYSVGGGPNSLPANSQLPEPNTLLLGGLGAFGLLLHRWNRCKK